MCFLGLHNWVWPWKLVYDEDGCIVGYYFKECANPKCRKIKIKAMGKHNKQLHGTLKSIARDLCIKPLSQEGLVEC